jgi:hypothetical protein
MSDVAINPDSGALALAAAPKAELKRAWLVWLLYLVSGAAVISPLIWAKVPPLVDYPNHLARMWILVHRGDIAELAQNYILQWRILPDLAMDFVVPALSQLMPVLEAGRIFIALTMAGLLAGTITLHRVLHGRFAVWPVLSALFVFNAVLFWGFLSCLFASAVYLFAFSGWIASRNWRPLPRLLLFSAVAATLFLLHAFAFGLYGLSVASYELARRWEGRWPSLRTLASYALVCLHFIPGLLLWYASLGNVRSAYTAYGDLNPKIYALMAPATFGVYAEALDRTIWLLVAIGVLLALTRGALKIVPQMRLPIAAMVLVAVLMPNWVNGSWGADFRLPVILPFVLIASTRLEIASKQLVRGFAVIAAFLFCLRIAAVSQSWQQYDRMFDEFRRASAVMPAGSRLLIVETPLAPDEERPAFPGVPRQFANVQPKIFHHMGALAVIDRSAYFPYLFTQATTIDAAPRNHAVAQTAAVPITPDELALSTEPGHAEQLDREPDIYGQLSHWRRWPETFDYVLWLDFSGKPKPQLQQLTGAASGSYFELYRINR